MPGKKLEDLLAGVASLSLINEPLQPIEPEKSSSAVERRKRFRVIEGRDDRE